MKTPVTVRLPSLALGTAALLTTAASACVLTLWAAPARSQIITTPTYQALGVASIGASSMAWFHEPTTGRAVACQAQMSGGTLSGVQCVVGKLP